MAVINATVAALQLKDGLTVRKVKGVLKVVAAKPRKAAIVKEKKEMLNAVRVVAKGYGFDWQGSLMKTLVANEKATFTAIEMYQALDSVAQGEDMDRFDRIEKYLDNLVFTLGSVPVRLKKIEDSYKISYIDRTWSECK